MKDNATFGVAGTINGHGVWNEQEEQVVSRHDDYLI